MEKEKFKIALKNWNGVVEYIENIPKFNESKYHIKETEDFIDSMFKRFCPFKIGDKVRLKKTPVINDQKSWGWRGFRHLLKKGCTGVIDEVGFSCGKFSFIFVPDNASWITSGGEKVPFEKDRIPRFGFNEDWLEGV